MNKGRAARLAWPGLDRLRRALALVRDGALASPLLRVAYQRAQHQLVNAQRQQNWMTEHGREQVDADAARCLASVADALLTAHTLLELVLPERADVAAGVLVQAQETAEVCEEVEGVLRLLHDAGDEPARRSVTVPVYAPRSPGGRV